MSDHLTLKKVLWRDGDVISEDHFYALEEWVEQLVGVVNQHLGTFGLVRNAPLQPGFNNPDGIAFKQVQGTHFRVEIEQLQAINAFGKVLKIEGRRAIDFHFKSAQRTPDGGYLLYIAPIGASPDGSQPSGPEVVTGTTLYDVPYELSTSNDDGTGVPICKFRYEESQMVADRSYIPFGIFMDSSPTSAAFHEELLGKFESWYSLLDRYIQTLKPTPDMMVIWSATGALYRLAHEGRPILSQRNAPTFSWFTSLQRFLGSISAELKIVAIGWPQESLKQRVAEVTETLDAPLMALSGQQFDLAGAFAQASKALDGAVKILSYMPAGPITEKTLPVVRAEVQKEAAGNKIVAHFEEESSFTVGKSRITIRLREFSKSEPARTDVRVGLGLAIFAQLRDLRNHLKKVPGEAFTYTIECPPELVTRERAGQLTMYLPPPLGEGVIDLKSHITVIVKD